MDEYVTISDSLQNLYEVGFKLNESKEQGCKLVDISTFEYLLNWSIENMTYVRDTYNLE